DSANREGEKAHELLGQCDSMERSLRERASSLLGGDDLLDLDNVLAASIRESNQQLSESEELIKLETNRVSRKKELHLLIPDREIEIQMLTEKQSALSETVSARKAKLDTLEKQADSIRSGLHFASKRQAVARIDSLRKVVSDYEKRLKQLQEDYTASKAEGARLKGEIHQLEDSLKDVREEDIAKLTSERVSLLETRRSLVSNRELAGIRLDSNSSALQNIKKCSEEITGLDQRYQWLNTLSETANGNIKGKEKISLESYVLTAYFDRILARATVHMLQMSSGQYDLIRNTSPESLRSQSGLELNVLDHYNDTVRSVKTLSGGESFLASLSLALGLSEKIMESAGGIRLDTMFVDEGFGSLDDDTLQQAMRALQSLTDDHRLVGIISHVSELRNQIDNQIIVKKDRTGKSSVEIRTEQG
ncbi:MAG: SMC family ATPase, partial [Clostridia bacterium]|nr:SMC family ATPase [Clostridia bacterium]